MFSCFVKKLSSDFRTPGNLFPVGRPASRTGARSPRRALYDLSLCLSPALSIRPQRGPNQAGRPGLGRPPVACSTNCRPAMWSRRMAARSATRTSHSMSGNAPPETPPPSRAGGGMAWPCLIDRQRGQQGGGWFCLCSSTRIYTGSPRQGRRRHTPPPRSRSRRRGQRGGWQAALSIRL